MSLERDLMSWERDKKKFLHVPSMLPYISEPVFYVNLVYKFKELLESLILVINPKR